MAERLLRAVEDRAEAYEAARAELYRAIRRAHAGGHSLRAIAAEALLSHEQVRRIVRNAPQGPDLLFGRSQGMGE